MHKIIILSFITVIVSGCAQIQSPSERTSRSSATSESSPTQTQRRQNNADLAIIEPLAASRARQTEVAQITALLEGDQLSADQKAVAYYRRGILYDQLGLPALALLNMNQVLELDPRFFDAWHYSGIYYTQHGDYQRAYEAFDSVIELNPEHDYVYLNRGLASYYDQQFELAVNDFADFYFQDPSDPYRIIWYYLSAREVNPARAKEQLASHRADVINNPWGHVLIDYYLGRINEQAVMNAAFEGIETHRELLERLCEAYFYLGKNAAFVGNRERAMNFYKLALMTNIYDFIEYRVARTELYRLRDQDATAQSD